MPPLPEFLWMTLNMAEKHHKNLIINFRLLPIKSNYLASWAGNPSQRFARGGEEKKLFLTRPLKETRWRESGIQDVQNAALAWFPFLCLAYFHPIFIVSRNSKWHKKVSQPVSHPGTDGLTKFAAPCTPRPHHRLPFTHFSRNPMTWKEIWQLRDQHPARLCQERHTFYESHCHSTWPGPPAQMDLKRN